MSHARITNPGVFVACTEQDSRFMRVLASAKARPYVLPISVARQSGDPSGSFCMGC